ncbi:MAG: (2Fe-2S)-binding protein [Cellulosilyticaceae bacterium]
MSEEKNTHICLCKAVLETTVKEAIRQGALTTEKVKIRTGASDGACKGSRCKATIQKLIDTYEQGEWK